MKSSFATAAAQSSPMKRLTSAPTAAQSSPTRPSSTSVRTVARSSQKKVPTSARTVGRSRTRRRPSRNLVYPPMKNQGGVAPKDHPADQADLLVDPKDHRVDQAGPLVGPGDRLAGPEVHPVKKQQPRRDNQHAGCGDLLYPPYSGGGDLWAKERRAGRRLLTGKPSASVQLLT